MKKNTLRAILPLLIILFATVHLMAQTRSITGVVTDKTGGVPIAGANVMVKGSNIGAPTDKEGKFELQVPASSTTLVISFLGYDSEEILIPETNYVKASLETVASELSEIVVVGSRVAQRTSTDTPLPVDVLSSKELQTTGQLTFDKALQYTVPSFNTVQTPVNDATSLLDPYEIRNMGPSRTLILVNGKRKNPSSLVYTQTSPGRGETGADISAIPIDAIKRVEILRDGASAQYGSDAIAGVMNIILKDNVDESSVTLRAGMTSEGDGESLGFSLNDGLTLTNKGFMNYTVEFSKVGLANRPGTVDAEGEASDFGADIADVQSFLAVKPDAGNINGSPETTASKFLINAGFELSENTQIYGNAAYIYKKVNSYANYRTPYWRDTDYGLLTPPGQPYLGYLPTFDGDLNDYNATIGFKTKKNGWLTDVSFTTGGNRQLYTIFNSVNRNNLGLTDADGNFLYRERSPIIFRAGGYNFSHNVGNIDISKPLSNIVSVAFGSEFRSENFQIIEGDLASYDAGGADSFSGNSKENSFTSNRYNFGGYVGLAFDFTENFLIDATGRIENYSDFGNAFVWKASSRYKFLDDNLTLRGSVSTGFRAPSLHQIYVQKAQYSFVPGAGIQVSGLVNNVSPQAKLVGVPNLDAERSTNMTIGIGAKPSPNLSFTIDYYDIRLKDRIVLSNEIGPTEVDADGNNIGTTPLDDVLRNGGIVSLSFFANALDTRTSGIDVVANYKSIMLGNGELNFNIAGNYMLKNERVGAVNNPQIIAGADKSVLNETQEALMFTSRPKFKGIFGVDYSINNLTFSLNNTVFGPTKFRNAGMDENLQIEFLTKVVTDLAVNYKLNDNVNFTFNVNNLFNVLPEWKFVALNADGETILNSPTAVKTQSNLITFNQRYSTMTYDGYHFSQLGTMFNFAVNLKF
jgi:iron complex outermembrane receptor protein